MQSTSPPGADKPMTEADLRDPVKRGFYLATIGHCMECHTPMVNGRARLRQSRQGRREFEGPVGRRRCRATSPRSKTKGIGDWSDAEIKRAITQGIRKDGSQLKRPMGFALYATMTDGDLGAIVAYLRTVPAKE